jgi:GntR family transcriptional regulator/MocR family aminotransferase
MARPRQGSLLPAFTSAGAPARWRRRDLLTHIRRLIADGALAPGDRLPSTRTLAEEVGLSRSTVEVVFDDLVAAGLVERRQGSGSIVTSMLGDLPGVVRPPAGEHERAASASAASAPAASSGRAASVRGQASALRVGRALESSAAAAHPSRLSTRGAMLAAYEACREPDVVRPFNAGVPDADGFPHEAWQRSMARVWRRERKQLLTRFDPLGHRPLREALWRYLTTFRGVRCTVDQIAVTTSSQSALHLLALLLIDPGDRVWLENPGYPGARAAMQAVGAKIVPLPVDRDGLRVDVGVRRAKQARLAYVTPSHQYPSGVMLGLDRRVALLAWAASQGAWVVEDDYDGEFRYAGLPAAALQGLDRAGRVIYLGTLSKVLSPSLRLAYLVMPEPLVEPFANLRTQVDGFTATPLQATLADFFETGQFEAHVRRMRARYAQKHDALTQALAFLDRAGGSGRGGDRSRQFELVPALAGFHSTILECTPGLARRAAAAATAFGLSLDALSQYALAPIERDGLMLRYGALSLDEIADGTQRLRRLLDTL